jgi:hypothetical protein
MRALVLAVAVLMSAVASAQENRRPPPPGQPTGPITPPAPPPVNTGPIYDSPSQDSPRRGGVLVVVEREQMLARLARMEELLNRAAERGDRHGRNALRKLDEELDALRYDVSNAPDLRSYRPPPPPPPPSGPGLTVMPISEEQLQQLMKAIGRESFGEGKLRVLEAAAPTQFFVVPQVLKVLQRFSFGEDKLDAVRVLWPRVLDRENAFQLYGAFTFPNEKEQLRQIIGG